MIIETENDALAAIGDRAVRKLTAEDDEDLGGPVEFNDENRARVPAEVGEFLADSREGVFIAKDERESRETTETTE